MKSSIRFHALLQDFLNLQQHITSTQEEPSVIQYISVVEETHQNELLYNRKPTSCDERENNIDKKPMQLPLSPVWSDRALKRINLTKWKSFNGWMKCWNDIKMIKSN